MQWYDKSQGRTDQVLPQRPMVRISRRKLSLVSPTATVVAATPAAPSLISMMTMMMVMTTTTTPPLILGRILQFTAGNRTSNHTQNGVPTHLLSRVTTSQSASNSTHNTALSFRRIRVVGSIWITPWWQVRVLVTLLLMLRGVTLLLAIWGLLTVLLT